MSVMPTESVLVSALTKTQRAELRHVYRALPDSLHDCDREPERWLRFVSRRATIEALRRAGLVEGGIYRDPPVGGYRAELSPAGIELRQQLRTKVEATP